MRTAASTPAAVSLRSSIFPFICLSSCAAAPGWNSMHPPWKTPTVETLNLTDIPQATAIEQS